MIPTRGHPIVMSRLLRFRPEKVIVVPFNVLVTDAMSRIKSYISQIEADAAIVAENVMIWAKNQNVLNNIGPLPRAGRT